MKCRKWLRVLFCLALALGLAVSAGAAQIPDVTAYSYEVTPLLSPFCYYLYVKTDNPDPTSFRLVDMESELYEEDAYGEIRVDTEYGYTYAEVDPGTYYISQSLYPDVVYEDESVWRVAGGYIFKAHVSYSDGGELTLLQKTKRGSNILNDEFEATDVTVPCQPMQDGVSYLIDTCTSGDMTFFENLDAVQERLGQIAVYPRYVYDINDPNEDRPYPLLAVSPYPELSLNDHYDMYNIMQDGLLASAAYPFILDSLGFPGTIGAVAERLVPQCQIESGAYHYQVNVTFEGETHSYGGAGSGGNDPLYSNRVQQVFTFRGGEDLATGGTVEDYCEHLLSYQSVAAEDAQQYRDLILGETFRQTIRDAGGGSWLRVATEGFGYGTSIAYVVTDKYNAVFLSDAWVDGRYVGEHEAIQLGQKFEDHPTADIVVQGMTYTDHYGNTYTHDVIYRYDEARDQWSASESYYGYWYPEAEDIPQELILTQAEVQAMNVDANSDHLPESCLIYDGKEYPGTPFDITIVTGVSVPETLTLYVGQQMAVDVTVEPEDAYSPRISCTSSDPEAVSTWEGAYDWYVKGESEGTSVLTVTTVDGGYSATCTVTVLPNPCVNGHTFTNYVSDGNAGCSYYGTMTGACDVCGVTETITDYSSLLPHSYEYGMCTVCGQEQWFYDVAYDAWYADEVQWAVENGITNGTDDTHFSPEDVCTRAQIVTFLWRSQGSPEPTSTVNPFVDVVEGEHTSWYYDAVLWAVENGITVGRDDTHFAPDEQCLRSEVVMFLWRAAGAPAAALSTNPFQDMTTEHWFYDPVMWAVGDGITNGVDDTHFGPDEECTRAQIVTFLYRYAN